MKKGVLIIECLDKKDPGSEGKCLKHIFNLMQIRSKYIHVTDTNKFISEITTSEFKYIHVTTHGLINGKSFRGWWTQNGSVKKKALSSLEGELKGKTIISTACLSGKDDFGKYIVDVLKCDYFIAPSKSPQFHNSAFFSHIFYHKLFKTKKDVKKAFVSYKQAYKNPHIFKLFCSKKSAP